MVRIKTRLSMLRSRCHQSLTSPQKRNVSHEVTHCPFRAWFEICVKAKSPYGKDTKQLGNPEHIRVIEFDYAFATDAPGDPNRRISLWLRQIQFMGSVFAVVARRKSGQDDYVMQSFQIHIDRLGLVKAELKCDQEPRTLDVANALSRRCQSTSLMVTATPKGSKGSLERGERANFDDSGTASGISRSRLNEVQDRSWA